MTFEIFYGKFPVKTIHVKVELGALKNREPGHTKICTV